jgi:ribosome-binding protein aMBF1 (putative translation factor)
MTTRTDITTTAIPKLRSIRLRQGVDITRLARMLDINRETIRLWEAGRTKPYPKNARRLEAALGRRLGELFASDTQNGPQKESR